MSKPKCPVCKREIKIDGSGPVICECRHTGVTKTKLSKKPRPEWIILNRSLKSTFQEEHVYEPVAIRILNICVIEAETTKHYTTVHIVSGSFLGFFVRETAAEIWKLIHGETPVVLPPGWTDVVESET